MRDTHGQWYEELTSDGILLGGHLEDFWRVWCAAQPAQKCVTRRVSAMAIASRAFAETGDVICPAGDLPSQAMRVLAQASRLTGDRFFDDHHHRFCFKPRDKTLCCY